MDIFDEIIFFLISFKRGYIAANAE